MKLFKEAATGSASNSVLDQLDRSNAIVRVLLSLLTSTQMENFSHVHECFNAGLDFATWYEAEGKWKKKGERKGERKRRPDNDNKKRKRTEQ